MRFIAIGLGFVALALGLASCGSKPDANTHLAEEVSTPDVTPIPVPSPTPVIPNLQAELLDERNTSSKSPIANFDFKNYTYELPRGWQNPDGSTEITLTAGRAAPSEANGNRKKADKTTSGDKEQGGESESLRRIGMTLVATKFFDITGDGDDEAVVILKIETGGSAIPQIVHVFSWKDGRPELIWPFRTGDRADGGLKNIYAEHGEFVVELYGQDRFLLGEVETGRIGDDLEQICCPTHFTRSVYKWNGKNFLMQGKRLTFLTADPQMPPVENLGDKVNAKPKAKK